MFAAVAAVVGLLALRAALGGSERDSRLERVFVLFVVCTSTPNQVNLSSYRAAMMGLSYFQLTLH